MLIEHLLPDTVLGPYVHQLLNPHKAGAAIIPNL